MAGTETKTVELTVPIMRGDTPVTAVTLTRPAVGALRGLNLLNILQMETGAMLALLPRITDLSPPEVEALHPHDWVNLCSGVTGFFAPPGAADQVEALLAGSD
jgi:hypothetical protein